MLLIAGYKRSYSGAIANAKAYYSAKEQLNDSQKYASELRELQLINAQLDAQIGNQEMDAVLVQNALVEFAAENALKTELTEVAAMGWASATSPGPTIFTPHTQQPERAPTSGVLANLPTASASVDGSRLEEHPPAHLRVPCSMLPALRCLLAVNVGFPPMLKTSWTAELSRHVSAKVAGEVCMHTCLRKLGMAMHFCDIACCSAAIFEILVFAQHE